MTRIKNTDKILSELKECGKVNITMLSDKCGIDLSNMSRYLKELEKKGQIKITVNQEGQKRFKEVEIITKSDKKDDILKKDIIEKVIEKPTLERVINYEKEVNNEILKSFTTRKENATSRKENATTRKNFGKLIGNIWYLLQNLESRFKDSTTEIWRSQTAFKRYNETIEQMKDLY